MKKILIVEDNIWLSEQYKRLLKRNTDFHIFTSRNGYEAIKIIDGEKIDLILLDILLDGVSGLALIHEIRSYGDTKNIPIILSSAIAKDIELEDAKKYGVKKILDKTTMLPEDVVNVVMEVLG